MGELKPEHGVRPLRVPVEVEGNKLGVEIHKLGAAELPLAEFPQIKDTMEKVAENLQYVLNSPRREALLKIVSDTVGTELGHKLNIAEADLEAGSTSGN